MRVGVASSARESRPPSTGQYPPEDGVSASSSSLTEMLLPPPEREGEQSYMSPPLVRIKVFRLLVVLHLTLSMLLSHHLSTDAPLISWPTYDNFVRAGHCSYSSVVFLTGFSLACERSSPMFGSSKGLFIGPVVQLYAPYLLSVFICAGLTQYSPEVAAGEVGTTWVEEPLSERALHLLWKCLCLDTWLSEKATSIHHREEAHRFVGGLLMLHFVFHPALRLMQDVLVSRSGRISALCTFWIGGALQAASNVGIRLTPLPVMSMACRIHTCEFLAGMVLGLMWLDGQLPLFSQDSKKLPLKSSWSSLALVVLLAVYTMVDVARFGLCQNGLLMPVIGFVACGFLAESGDALSSMLDSKSAKWLMPLAFPALASQDLTYYLVHCVWMKDTGKFLEPAAPRSFALLATVLVVSAVMHQAIVKPLSLLALQQFTLPSLGLDTPVALSESRPSRHMCLWRRVQDHCIFYGSFLTFNLAYFSLILYWLMHRPMKAGVVSNVLCELPLLAHAVGLLKWAIAAPATFLSLAGQLLYNPMSKEAEPTVESLLEQGGFDGCKLRFRYVTRGMNGTLVRQNVAEAMHVLSQCQGLPEKAWVVEVVTDMFMGINEPAIEIVVPATYAVIDEFGSETKFKARALNYAIEHGGADDSDWIVHLDEETRFDNRSVVMILKHCVEERRRAQSGECSLPAVGQGVILYGTGRCGPVVNWVTTLADSIRVADDFGKFRLQFSAFERPFIGMHGSYVVTNHTVEKAVGFRYGLVGSITEDAHWSLMATAHHDVRFKWIDANMYEQSPFDLQDFVKQRRRWFAGICLVCEDPRIPWKWRVFIRVMNFWWLVSLPLGLFGTLAAFSPADMTPSYMIAVAMAGTFSTWNYVTGFIMTYRLSDGVPRYLVLLSMQLILQPFFMFLEYGGVLLSLLKPAFKEFHIVQKEAP
mmetsp:Transcript_51917/g.121485  ORF Transcript_51917/g.121485 Transcript_51917/m.121485 type:complete len:928 (+) Transcript_51917:88-2871(+)